MQPLSEMWISRAQLAGRLLPEFTVMAMLDPAERPGLWGQWKEVGPSIYMNKFHCAMALDELADHAMASAGFLDRSSWTEMPVAPSASWPQMLKPQAVILRRRVHGNLKRSRLRFGYETAVGMFIRVCKEEAEEGVVT